MKSARLKGGGFNLLYGNKQQISLTIAPALLVKIDKLAAELGQSRAAVINMAIYRAVEHGLIKE